MAKLVKLNSENNGNYSISLNGVTYLWRVYWNQYVNRWNIDVKDLDDNPIAMGLAIVANRNLLRYSPTLTAEIGQLWAFDLLEQDCSIREELGKNTVIVFYAPGEFEATFPNHGEVDTRPFPYDFDSLFTAGP